jgi:hypothetical protein
MLVFGRGRGGRVGEEGWVGRGRAFGGGVERGSLWRRDINHTEVSKVQQAENHNRWVVPISALRLISMQTDMQTNIDMDTDIDTDMDMDIGV